TARLRQFRITPPLPDLSSFLSCSFRVFGCGKATSFGGLFQRGRSRAWLRSDDDHEEREDIREQEEERSEGRRSLSLETDRRPDQGAGGLARPDARPAAWLDQASRPRRGRGVEVARGSGVVARRNYLHG